MLAKRSWGNRRRVGGRGDSATAAPQSCHDGFLHIDVCMSVHRRTAAEQTTERSKDEGICHGSVDLVSCMANSFHIRSIRLYSKRHSRCAELSVWSRLSSKRKPTGKPRAGFRVVPRLGFPPQTTHAAIPREPTAAAAAAAINGQQAGEQVTEQAINAALAAATRVTESGTGRGSSQASRAQAAAVALAEAGRTSEMAGCPEAEEGPPQSCCSKAFWTTTPRKLELPRATPASEAGELSAHDEKAGRRAVVGEEASLSANARMRGVCASVARCFGAEEGNHVIGHRGRHSKDVLLLVVCLSAVRLPPAALAETPPDHDAVRLLHRLQTAAKAASAVRRRLHDDDAQLVKI